MQTSSPAVAPRTREDYSPPATPYLTVLYHDDDILIVAKQSGLLSVPGRGPDRIDSIASRAQETFPGATIVHRLDMDTSGVMVIARTPAAHRHLSRQFELREVAKTYVARVSGIIATDKGEVDAPLICDWPRRPRQKVDYEQGRSAQTAWHVISRESNATRVCLTPKTGRSHQLRVHMASIGHPILGDNLYAGAQALAAADRLQLHARSLSFCHPSSGGTLNFEDACPF